MSLKDKLGLDDKDLIIMSYLMKNHSISQSELASVLKLSQPSVNMRLHKLKQRGVLSQQFGINGKKINLAMARVDFTCRDADEVLNSLKKCPFFINGFQMSGVRNASVLLLGENLKKTEQIIKQHIRSNKSISNIDVNIIVNVAKDFVFTINLEEERKHHCSETDCSNCRIRIKQS